MEAVVRDVPGWMRPEDALKLYELAHFAPGPILEIGAYHGKSAIVLALGARAGRTGATVLSVDVDAHALRAARAQVGRHGVGGSVVFFRGSARALARAARGIRPGLVFVDGDHSRRGCCVTSLLWRTRSPLERWCCFTTTTTIRRWWPFATR